MKKLSKIDESVWSDIHKRSNGKTVRKEDSVDLLSPEDFIIYLKKHYRIDNSPYDFMFSETLNSISIPIYVYNTKDIHRTHLVRMLYFSYDDYCAYVNKDIKKYAPKLYSKLENDFDLWDDYPDYRHYIIITPLDKDRTPNNSYVLELIEYIIKNIDEELTQVLSKKSKINESIWADIYRRSNGDVVRKEDAFNPDYVDFGENTTVYWMQDNLEIDGESKFSFEDVRDYNNNGWRLPTLEEVLQIDWSDVRQPWYEHCTHLIFPNKIELRIMRDSNNGCHMWASDYDKKFPTCAQSYGFDNMGKFNTDSFNFRWNKLYVFLVKDKKKVNESVWADIHRRSNGTQERTEDIPTNIKNLVPVDMGVSVLWADQDLEFKDGNVFFTYNEAIDCIKNTDWRLPTKKEYNELTAKTKLLVNTDYEYSCQGKGVTGMDLHFYKKGLKYASDMVYHSEKYYSWTSSKASQENGVYFVNVFKVYQAMQPMDYLNKVCVRLVKDKK